MNLEIISKDALTSKGTEKQNLMDAGAIIGTQALGMIGAHILIKKSKQSDNPLGTAVIGLAAGGAALFVDNAAAKLGLLTVATFALLKAGKKAAEKLPDPGAAGKSISGFGAVQANLKSLIMNNVPSLGDASDDGMGYYKSTPSDDDDMRGIDLNLMGLGDPTDYFQEARVMESAPVGAINLL